MGLNARAASPAGPAPYVVAPSQQFDGNDGFWSTFSISVGTPAQDFRVLPSTKGGVTYVIAPEGCALPSDPADCPNLRGAQVFQSTQNIGFQSNASDSWSALGQYGVDLEDSLNYTADGLFGFDKVALGPAANSASLSLDHQVVAGVAEPDYFMGVLPLGDTELSFSSLSQPIRPLLYQLQNASMIPSFSYAYTAGAKYRFKSVFGSLILGGYDSTRFMPNTNEFSFTFSTDPSKLLTVGVDAVMATNTLKGAFSLSSGAHFSVIDSTVSHLWLPTDICNQFEDAFGLTYDPQTDLYLVNDTIHQQLQSLNPTIIIKLVNLLSDTTTNYTNIELPYAAFDLQASYPLYTNATNYFPIRRAANDTQYVLGRTLLQEAYLIVDYERANFTLAQAKFSDPLPAANIVTISPSASTESSSTSSSLSTGAIVGIAIGSAAFILLVGILVFFLRKRRTKQTEKHHELDASLDSSASSDGHGSHTTMSTPRKAPGLQEIGGTPLTELATHEHYPRGYKGTVSMNSVPQELHAESMAPMTPVTPRWQEVHLPPPPAGRYDVDGESGESSQNVSTAPSVDGERSQGSGRYAGVSPLTERFHGH
jgi:hypothetical protein